MSLTARRAKSDRRATQCERPGSAAPLCAPTAGADTALLDAQTPFGPLHLTHALIDRERGFTNSVAVTFTTDADGRVDGFPAATVRLPDPFDSQDLVGSHDVFLYVATCDRSFEVPVRVTVTTDEIVPDLSERFEATIDSLAADIELHAEAVFSHVCQFSTSI